jgi:hypothetical protein
MTHRGKAEPTETAMTTQVVRERETGVLSRAPPSNHCDDY